MTNWAIVPVKNLDHSKSRLSDVLSVDARRELICSLLTRTLSLLNESEFIEKTIVISNDKSVLQLADKQGVFTVQEDSPSDLNSALHQATLVTMKLLILEMSLYRGFIIINIRSPIFKMRAAININLINISNYILFY